MNNIGTLYLAEIRKAMSRKSIWICLVLGLAVIITINGSNALFDEYSYPDGSKMTGSEYYRNEAENCVKLSGRPVDDAFLDEVRDRISNFAVNKGYTTRDALDRLKRGEVEGSVTVEENTGSMVFGNDVLVALDNAAEQLGLGDVWYFIQDAVDDSKILMTCNSEEFHKAWKQSLSYRTAENRGASDEEFLAYWGEKADSIKMPLTYSYQRGIDVFVECAWSMVWLIFLLVALSLAGIFADERSSRMDALILSSRNGRSSIAVAKLLAGFTVSMAEALAVFGITYLGTISFFGSTGWDAPIQMFTTSTAWNFTGGQVIVTYLLLILIMAVLFAAATMFLSGLTGGTQTLGIQMAVLMIGFFNLPFDNIVTHLWDIRPTAFLTTGVLHNYYLFSFGTIKLNCICMATLLYLLFAIAFSLSAITTYKRYQIKSR